MTVHIKWVSCEVDRTTVQARLFRELPCSDDDGLIAEPRAVFCLGRQATASAMEIESPTRPRSPFDVHSAVIEVILGTADPGKREKQPLPIAATYCERISQVGYPRGR